VTQQERKPVDATGLRNRIRYHFDNLLSRGTWAVLLWLLAITLLVVLISSLLLTAFGVNLDGSDEDSWPEDFWQSAMRTLDPGTMADDVGWGPRLIALVVTLFGVLIAGALIGIIVSGVERSVERMQRGRSTVVQSDHVVILGASARLTVIIRQLALAGKTRRRNAIVVLANREPAELNRQIRANGVDLHGSRLVFRWGDPSRTADLALVAIDRARTVIVLADDDAGNDAGVIKAVLSAGAVLGGFDRIPMIAELGDPRVGESLLRACGGLVSPLTPMQAVASMTTYTLRQPGLSQVLHEMVDFHGADLYIRELDDLDGCRFGDAVFRYSKTRPIGRMKEDGAVELNPDPDTRLGDGDRLIVLAEDDRAPTLADREFTGRSRAPAQATAARTSGPREEHILILGWNSLGERLVEQLGPTSAPGSSVQILYDPRLLSEGDIEIGDTVSISVTATAHRARTLSLGDESRHRKLTSIVLLGYRVGLSPDDADSRTLLTLMLLRRRLDELDDVAPQVVVELLDADNVDLAQTSGADDFVVSDAIASRLMTQLADQPARRAVLESLYSMQGPSLDLVEASLLGVHSEVEFGEIIEVAYSFGLLAIGWRRADERADGREGQLTLNPGVSERVRLDDGDQIVVIG
jgi:Trk K+ transport system NAD-binding subunit